MAALGKKMFLLFAAALLLIVPTTAGAQDKDGLQLESKMEPRRGITVGDPLLWTLQVTTPKGRRVQFPALGSEQGDFQILEQRSMPEAEAAGGRTCHTLSARVTLFRTGKFEWPAQKVTVIDPSGKSVELTTPVEQVEVQSVLPKEEKAPELKDLKGQAVLEESYLWLWLTLLGTALMALLLWWLMRRWKSKKSVAMEKTVLLLPPWEEAREALEALLSGSLTQRDRLFYFRLSEIVRRMIGRQYQLLTLERTTRELIDDLGRVPHEPVSVEELDAFLSWCDLIKFARHEPPAEEQGRLLAATRGFIEDAHRAWERERQAQAAEEAGKKSNPAPVEAAK